MIEINCSVKRVPLGPKGKMSGMVLCALCAASDLRSAQLGISTRSDQHKRRDRATCGRGPSGGADRLMERGHPITIDVPFLDQSVSGLGDPSPLGRIAEARYRIAEIGEVRVESDIVLVGGQNVIVPAPQQNLAGSGPGGIEVTGGDAFGIDRAARAVGKEAGFDICETHLPLVECLVP